MKLQDLVPYLESKSTLYLLYNEINFQRDDINLLIYMKDTLNVKSEVFLFTEEETEDHLIFLKEGQKFVQLFPIELALDLIENDLDLKGRGFSDLEIAEHLIQYALLDG